MKSKNYILLVFLSALTIHHHAQNKAAALDKTQVRQIVDSLSHQLLKHYVFKEEAIKMSNGLKTKQNQKAYDTILNPFHLADILTKDVKSIFKDEHFHVIYDTRIAYEVSGEIEDIPKFVEEKLQEERVKNFGFKKIEILKNNIGYLELSYFSRLNDYSKSTATSAFKLLANCNALIIDLRYGSGGSPEMVNFIMSHFFEKKTHVNDIYIRSENATIKYVTEPDTSYAHFYKMPLYILCSHTTFSAAEALTFELKNFKRATICGEVTRGGAHVVNYFPISNGFVADIPFGRAISPLKIKNWEGTGIAPHEACKAEEALDVAIKKINQIHSVSAPDSNGSK